MIGPAMFRSLFDARRCAVVRSPPPPRRLRGPVGRLRGRRRRPRQGQARRPGQRRRGVPLRGGAAAARQDPREAPRLQVHGPVRDRPEDGTINPNRRDNIPGLEALETADLMVIFTRFRNLPDDQMKHIVDYVESGKPIVGMRTATHAFNIEGGRPDLRQVRLDNADKDWERRLRPPGARRDLGQPPRQPRQAEHARDHRRGRQGPPDPPRASRTATSGARPTSTASACRCPATASRWSWGRCSRA